MIRVDRAIDGGASPVPEAALLLTVHDELVFELPAARAEDFKRWVKDEMEAVYTLAVPLVVDVGSGPTWGRPTEPHQKPQAGFAVGYDG